MDVRVRDVGSVQLSVGEDGGRGRGRFQQALVPDSLTKTQAGDEDEEESQEGRGSYETGFHLIFPNDEVLSVDGRLLGQEDCVSACDRRVMWSQMDGMAIIIASSCKCITCQNHEDDDYNQRLMRYECRVQSSFLSESMSAGG